MSATSDLVLEAIGENVDALITMDLRGYHVGRILYRAARAARRLPLTLCAARALAAALKPGGPVLVLTGFPFLPYGKPELDGAVGSAVLARALDVARDARPVIVTDPVTAPAMRSLVQAAGLNVYDSPEDLTRYPHSGSVVAFTLEQNEAPAQASELLDRLQPSALVAVEKPGANAGGRYRQGNGADVTSLVAKTDVLFDQARARGLTTIAIGDLGNELGLGELAEVVEAETPFAARFLDRSSGGIAVTTRAEHVIAASVSDWGAYGLAAMLGVVMGVPGALHDGRLERQLLWTAVHSGLLDGSGRGEPAVDGVGEEYNVRLVEMLGEVCAITLGQSARFAKVIERLAEVRASAGGEGL